LKNRKAKATEVEQGQKRFVGRKLEKREGWKKSGKRGLQTQKNQCRRCARKKIRLWSKNPHTKKVMQRGSIEGS